VSKVSVMPPCFSGSSCSAIRYMAQVRNGKSSPCLTN
jgi:hypothetical protein